jgi:hypothetical protein
MGKYYSMLNVGGAWSFDSNITKMAIYDSFVLVFETIIKI